MPIKIRVGHTPDADDAFMFYGIESGSISTGEFQIEHVVEDIEKLNKKALNHDLEITAVSAHAYAYLNEYVILNSGGSFGINYGPIIVSKENHTVEKIKEGLIGIPGEMTSAFLLMSIAFGKLNCRQMLFSDIPNAVLHGDVDYGLIIHEPQITFSDLSLNKVFDLGTWWNDKTNGLPVPLGINVASKKHLGPQHIIEFDNILKNSITYGLENLDRAVDFSTKYGRNTLKDTLAKFIQMYVNDFTVDMKKEGRDSISTLFHLAKLSGILGNIPEIMYSD